MFRRLGRHLSVVLALFATMLTLPAEAQTAAAAPHIIAVGDLHGDWHAWRQIAIASGIMDAKGNWAGGTTVFVQTGDVPDRGPDTLKIIADLQRLQKQATKAGGKVWPLIGNHEAMNVTGDLRYVTPGEYQAFVTPKSAALRDQYYAANQEAIESAYRAHGDPQMLGLDIRNAWYAANPLGKIEHQIAWGPKGKIGSWIVTNQAVLQLGDTIFVHGGLSAAHDRRPIDDLNKAVKQALLEQNRTPDAIINNAKGPLWYRGLARKPGEAPSSEDGPADATAPADVATELDEMLKAYGANRIVIGHTPQLAGISLRQDNRLILIDTGISAYYNGKVSWLDITNGTPTPHEIPRVPAPATGVAKP